MQKRITRRKALTAGTLIGTSYSASAQEKAVKKSPLPFLTPWSPSLDPEGTPTPGATPVRLACAAYRLQYAENINIPEAVKRVRDKGYTAAIGGGYDWLSAPESAIVELKKALKKFSATKKS